MAFVVPPLVYYPPVYPSVPCCCRVLLRLLRMLAVIQLAMCDRLAQHRAKHGDGRGKNIHPNEALRLL